MACTGHTGTGFCTGHNGTVSCGGHVNSCGAHGGQIAGWTPTYTTGTVTTADVIELQNELNELTANLNTEATRRSLTTGSLSFASTVDQAEIRALRDKFLYVCTETAVSPYSNTQIVTGANILANTIEQMKVVLDADAAVCLCLCNYSCTCLCNYACTCDCNYACTCNCNYPCVCNCAYSDEELKENIIYI